MTTNTFPPRGSCRPPGFHRRIQSAIAGLALFALCTQGGIVFEENFRSYADSAPGVTPTNGMSVGNDPIWNNAYELNVRAKRASNVYAEGLALPKDNRFDVLFSFRFLNSTMPKKADPKKEGDKDEPGVASSFDVVLRTDRECGPGRPREPRRNR